TTNTQAQNINAKSQLKTTPAEHAANKWRSISDQQTQQSQQLRSHDEFIAAAHSLQSAVDHSHNSKASKCAKNCAKAKQKVAKWKAQLKSHHVHQAHRAAAHKEAKRRLRRETVEEQEEMEQEQRSTSSTGSSSTTVATSAAVAAYANKSLPGLVVTTVKAKRARSTVHLAPEDMKPKPKEPVIIIDDVEEFDSGTSTRDLFAKSREGEDSMDEEGPLEPRVLPLRPVPPNPYEDEEMSVVYAEQHSEIRLMCEVDLDISSSMWYKNGQVVHAMDRTSRITDYRFIKEANGALTITNVMLEDDGKWQCEAENTRRYTENARPVKLVVLDRPKPPYLLIDSRRLDAGNIFVPVKENSELNLACVSEGGNPRPTLTWEVLLSPGVDRHAQKVSAEVLELEEIKNEKDKNGYKINSGAKSDARLPAVYRAHHNARILCVMEHPTLKIRQNASLLLDVQYTPSFAISRTPGFGYPLREGIEVSLKCDVDSNPPSTPRWQKDDGDTPVPQTGDGFLNFTSIRREHSGWYKCTSRHLNFQYSSIGYYLSVRYDSVDVTSEPDDQDVSVAAASHNPNKGQLEVQLGGAVTLQCPQGSLGCWSHLDPVSARLRGLGYGSSQPTGQFSLKDVMYQDAGTYKCVGQSLANKKKLEVLQSVIVSVKGAPTVVALNATPVAYPGSPLHLNVEFCANPPAHAARWLHGDRVFTPGNQYGSTVLAYSVKDLPTPYCKEARLTYVSMHERVPRTFYFIVSTPGGVAEAVFNVNFTKRHRQMSNAIDDDEEEELNRPEQIHFPVFSNNTASSAECFQLALVLTLVLGAALMLQSH
ncbi:CG8314, partial [Drosophila busckii]